MSSDDWRDAEETTAMIGSKRRLWAYVSLAAALALSGGARVIAQSSIPRETPVLHDLAGLPELQAAFDQDSEQLRLVLLLSPT